MTNPVMFSENKFFFDAGQAQRLNDRHKVTLYFIGYTLVSKDGVYPKFPVKGRIIQAPPIGESIVLDSVVANDLLSRSQVYDPKIGWVQSFTTDPAIAKAVKQAFDAGYVKFGDTVATMQKAIDSARLKALSDEDLEAELERRKPRTMSNKKSGEVKDG